ncbi:MAG: enoyl-CoA hydratase [Deltaproteobacteria bacterium]|nr:enoyl-CoA hydratase [Deltaproteobacteria bacterium]
MDYETIQIGKKGMVATITLNRPKQLNALNVVVCDELMDAVNQCKWDKGIRSVVLTGTGKAFCSGGDVREMRDFCSQYPNESPGKIVGELVSAVNLVLLAIRKLEKPVIGAIKGPCSGGGAGLALACDILIAAEDTKIHVPNILIGLVPDGGNSFFLTQKLGRYKAAELYFTAEPLDALEAIRLGIFNRVVPETDLLREAEDLALRLASGPVPAMALAKRMLDLASYNNLETQLEVEKEAVIRCGDTKEFKEGITAFFEKRNPDFVKL